MTDDTVTIADVDGIQCVPGIGGNGGGTGADGIGIWDSVYADELVAKFVTLFPYWI